MHYLIFFKGVTNATSVSTEKIPISFWEFYKGANTQKLLLLLGWELLLPSFTVNEYIAMNYNELIKYCLLIFFQWTG